MTALTLQTARAPLSSRRPATDLSPGFRVFLATGAGLVLLPILCALLRAMTGLAPGGVALKEVALAIHLATVIPAIPLGAYVLLKRKGSPRHRMLGKIWLGLMIVAAVSAFWIRHLNDGRLSAIHILIPVVLVASWRAVASARAGNIAAHRRGLVLMFVGALLIPGITAFVPGRPDVDVAGGLKRIAALGDRHGAGDRRRRDARPARRPRATGLRHRRRPAPPRAKLAASGPGELFAGVGIVSDMIAGLFCRFSPATTSRLCPQPIMATDAIAARLSAPNLARSGRHPPAP